MNLSKNKLWVKTQQEGEFGMQTVFTLRCPNNEERLLTFNQTSQNNLIDSYTDETKQWVGKKVKIWVVKQNVSGKFKNVVYLTSPDKDLEGAPIGELEDNEPEGEIEA